MSSSNTTTEHCRQSTSSQDKQRKAIKPRLPASLVLWIAFWPSFLLSILLNELRIRFKIEDEWALIASFTIYVPLCTLGILMAVRRLR